ncbi:MAG: hypothetical protein IT437_00320 [Phycisphaerales bacterium]|nr:hypothetical protein [Phycisphaerales bacterium]
MIKPVVFVAACSLAVASAAPAQVVGPVDQAAGADQCAAGRILRDRYRLGLPPRPPGGFTDEALGDTDVQHYSLEVEVFPATQTISGTNVMTVKSLVSNLTQFTFRLRDTFAITSALLNGTTAAAVNTTSSTTRVVTLDRAYGVGEVFTLTIAYNGAPDGGGFGSFNFTTEGGYPFIDTLSEPYYAHTWWPCKDGDVGAAGDNSDKATMEIAVIAPDTLTTVSNGLPVGTEPLAGGRLRTRWATNYVMPPYLLCFATGRFNTWSITYNYTQGTMPVQFFIWPGEDNAANRSGWEKCTQMMDAFRPVFGLYPFVNEKYGIYNFTFGGGMEHQTCTGQSGYTESLTSHELTHQWWGDNVTCRTWSDIWLNEGFATYGEAIWLERKPGSSGTPALLAAMEARRPTSFNGSVYRTNLGSVNSIFSTNYTYRKGAWVLHQLRHIVGDQAFFDILAQYRAQYEGSAATTDDFAAVASAVAGQDLSWFFQEWVYGIGAPTYQYGYQNVSIAGQDYVRVHLRQSQQAGYGIYTMPVDIRVNTAGGNQTITVWNNAPLQHYLLPVSAPATGIVVDEFDWILAQNKTSQTYVNGPPKVVAADPAPGASVPGSPAFHADITFSENVTAAGADFTLTGPGGAVPLSLNYNAATFTAGLDVAGAVPPGQYTLTVNDSVKSAAAAIALDGEVAGALPSGDGLPGGDTVIVFNVTGPACYPDCNGDGALNLADFGCFQTKFALGDQYTDCNSDGVLNLSDFGCFTTKFALGCP